VFEILYI